MDHRHWLYAGAKTRHQKSVPTATRTLAGTQSLIDGQTVVMRGVMHFKGTGGFKVDRPSAHMCHTWLLEKLLMPHGLDHIRRNAVRLRCDNSAQTSCAVRWGSRNLE
jgi:hypothetical protein